MAYYCVAIGVKTVKRQTEVHGASSACRFYVVLMERYRFYGAVEIDSVVYRTKSTIKEYRDKNTALKPYTYEVTKIKLLPNSTADANDAHGRPLSIESNYIDASKLLQNVEKSYDKGVKILDESVATLSSPPRWMLPTLMLWSVATWRLQLSLSHTLKCLDGSAAVRDSILLVGTHLGK